MSVPPNKRSTMSLYSGNLDPYSHRIRIVLAEKGVTADINDINKNTKAREELSELNPYGNAPMLVDRELVLYQSEIIMEYLDERFPHPPLLPVYPVARARSRLMIYRVNRDWATLADKILLSRDLETPDILAARKSLTSSLTSIAPVFIEMPYFMSEEFSLVDCCIAPMLWRLPIMGIELPNQAKPVLSYAARIFERDSFINSLTDAERTLR